MRSLPIPISTVAVLLLGAGSAGAQLQHAPEPREVGGRTAVPIDIEKLEATLVFDLRDESAAAVADLRFRAGKVDGHPVFDLRQEIRSARLDGESIEPAAMGAHDFGRLTGTMRVLDRKLKAGSPHHLHLEYPVGKPDVPQPLPPKYTEEGVTWDTWASDLRPGRYLEQWFPANLVFDQFSFTLDLKVEGAGPDQKHELVTNGAVQARGPLHWKITFPPHFTAFSPMVVLIPAALVDRSVQEVKLKNGQRIKVDVCRPKKLQSRRSSLEKMHESAAAALQDFTTHMGPWPHGDRCTIFEYSGGRSMEYDGATTSSYGALRHELFHSYFGRGLKPASQNGGWWDEAFTTYFLPRMRSSSLPDRIGRAMRNRGGRQAGRVALSTADPWNRVTPGESYGLGAWFFAQVAALIGEEQLHTAMRELCGAHAPNPISTAQLQAHLEGVAGKEKAAELHDLFELVIYGRKPLVRFQTALGSFDVEVETGAAPITGKNFLRYVEAGFYDGGRFHRAVRPDNQVRSDVPIQVVQAGIAPAKDGSRFPPIELETTRTTGLKHRDGTISMARSEPDSARSDFFICVGDQPSLDYRGERNPDGQGFAAFGRIVAGMEVVQKIHAARTEGEKLTPAVTIESVKRIR